MILILNIATIVIGFIAMLISLTVLVRAKAYSWQASHTGAEQTPWYVKVSDRLPWRN